MWSTLGLGRRGAGTSACGERRDCAADRAAKPETGRETRGPHRAAVVSGEARAHGQAEPPGARHRGGRVQLSVYPLDLKGSIRDY